MGVSPPPQAPHGSPTRETTSTPPTLTSSLLFNILHSRPHRRQPLTSSALGQSLPPGALLVVSAPKKAKPATPARCCHPAPTVRCSLPDERQRLESPVFDSTTPLPRPSPPQLCRCTASSLPELLHHSEVVLRSATARPRDGASLVSLSPTLRRPPSLFAPKSRPSSTKTTQECPPRPMAIFTTFVATRVALLLQFPVRLSRSTFLPQSPGNQC